MGNAATRHGELDKKYVVHEVIGRGGLGVVKRGVRRSDKLSVAVRILSKSAIRDASELHEIVDEIKLLSELKNPGCMRVYDVFETKKKIYVVIERLSGGDLFDRIVEADHLTERDAARTLRALTTTVASLHAEGIVHRDLKPEHVLYAKRGSFDDPKIYDFGLAKRVLSSSGRDLTAAAGSVGGVSHLASETKQASDDGGGMVRATLTTTCGTPAYVAPEILEKQKYDCRVDIWSLGVILYVMLCGFPPFHSESHDALFDQIKRGDYEFYMPYWRGVSQTARSLIRKMLQTDPTKRITASEILEHEWVRRHCSADHRATAGQP